MDHNIDYLQNVGQIVSKFRFEGESQPVIHIGTGVLYHQISIKLFTLLTSADNFVKFGRNSNKSLIITQVRPNDSRFYLQRSGLTQYKIECTSIKITVHPEYYDQGPEQPIHCGANIALAVVEITDPRFRQDQF